MLVGVGNELLYDELEAVRLGFAPDVDGLLVARRDDGLLPEGECILLPFDRLQKVRRLEPAVRERLGAVHRERLRRRDACFRGFRRKQVLAAQTPDDLRVRRKRHVGALEHLVPVPQDEVDVLVALRYEDCPLGVCKASQAGEHPAVAFLLGAAGHDAAIAQIAGAEAELVRAERAAEDRNPASPEAASERESGREQPEDEDGAMRTLSAGACHGGHYAGLGSAGYVTPPGGSSQRVRRFQRATSHPSRRCTRAQTRLPSTVPTIRATCGPP